ncbi:MAG: hypothetical protein ACKPEY_00555, partial [Planctomycetota bacterium]
MNARQLEKLGLDAWCIPTAIRTISKLASQAALRGKEIESQIKDLIARPDLYVTDPGWGELAQALIDSKKEGPSLAELPSIPYPIWECAAGSISEPQVGYGILGNSASDGPSFLLSISA